MNIIIFTSSCLNTSSGSVATTLNILNNLPDNFKVNLVLVDSLVDESKKMKDIDVNKFSEVINHPRVISINDLKDLSVSSLTKLGDKAIIAIYNFLGEDGILPALCALCGIKILSTPFSSSAICFDKNWTRQMLKASNILVPKGIAVDLKDKNSYDFIRDFFKISSGKIILKPVSCGASRGCTVCINVNQIKEGIEKAIEFSDQILCEEFIEGKEYTIGFINYGKSSLKILPPVEIITSRGFFDYKAKYEDLETREICPAQTLKENTLEEVHGIIKSIVKTFRIESHARVDFIVSNNKIYVLEVNTFPGLMENSLFPKELQAAGISMKEFISNAFSS